MDKLSFLQIMIFMMHAVMRNQYSFLEWPYLDYCFMRHHPHTLYLLLNTPAVYNACIMSLYNKPFQWCSVTIHIVMAVSIAEVGPCL